MTGTPEQLIRICALHEARLADERHAAHRAERFTLVREAAVTLFQMTLAVLLVGLVAL